MKGMGAMDKPLIAEDLADPGVLNLDKG